MSETTRNFLARALPWPAPGQPGKINLHWSSWKRPGITGGRPFTSLEDTVSFINWAKGEGKGHIRELYYCTSLQNQAGPVRQGSDKPMALRNRQNTLCSKALFADIDKGYPSPTEAIRALIKFCEDTGSPHPSALVVSGNGIHVYWFSTVALPPATWGKYARALDTLLTTHGVKHDSVTTDITRLLRPPGTYNNKGYERGIPPKPVELKLLSPSDIDFSTWHSLNAVQTLEPAGVIHSIATEDIYVNPEDANVAPSKLITDNLKPEDWGSSPLPLEPILQCPMFKHTLDTRGDGIPQPLWNQQALACTFIEGGEKLFHQLSDGDPRYNYDDTAAMYARKVGERERLGLGYPSCETFARDGSKQCNTCSLKGTIRSPLNMRLPKPQPAKVTAPPPATAHAANNPHGLVLPPGYAFSNRRPGAIDCVTLSVNKVPEQHEMIMSVLWDFKCTTNRIGEYDLTFKASTNLAESTEVTLKNSILTSPQEIVKTMYSAGVSLDPTQSHRICRFMTTFMSRLLEVEQAISGVPYGWISTAKQGEKTEITGFAYGGKVFNTNGTVGRSTAGDRVLQQTYMPRGDRATWLTALDILLNQNRVPLQTIALTGFASPLMKLTGFHGVSVLVWGDTGANKSTGAYQAMSVWGSPKGIKEVPSTSLMSLQGKMAETRHLLNVWDDIQPLQYERIARLVMEVTQGKGGGKMTPNHAQKDMGEWDAILLTTSNDSLGSIIQKLNKNNAAALSRCFEFKVEKSEAEVSSSLDVQPFYTALDDNFGYMGYRYAELLGHKITRVRELIKAAQEQIEKCMGGVTGADERYWSAAATCLLASAYIANSLIVQERKDLGLPAGPLFDIDGVRDHVIEIYRAMRLRVGEAAITSSKEDYVRLHLSNFLNEHTKNTIWTGVDGDILHPDLVSVRHMGQVMVRWRVPEKTLVISSKVFNGFLEREKITDAVIAGMKKHYGATKTRLCIAAGTDIPSAQEYLLQIPVKDDSWLTETLNQFTYVAKQASAA
jgi:hypothetical protein